MNIKRAIGASVLAYLASLVVGIVVAVIFDINLEETEAVPPILWYTGAITAVFFVGVFSFWYFRSPSTTPSASEGFRLGLVMIATGFLLDFITLLPLFTHEDPFGPMLEYYLDPFFLGTLVLVLGVTTLVGRHLGTSRENTLP